MPVYRECELQIKLSIVAARGLFKPWLATRGQQPAVTTTTPVTGKKGKAVKGKVVEGASSCSEEMNDYRQALMVSWQCSGWHVC